MGSLHLVTSIALALTATAVDSPATGDAQEELWALSSPVPAPDFLGALPPMTDIVFGALSPAPDRVYLETRSFGTVMVDHRAHLARRVACKACHGPGPVSQIEFTPKSAHDSCRACH